jgi:hypothetical protein
MAEVMTCDEIVLQPLTESVKTLADIRPRQAAKAQQAAQMRLQLWTVGETHRILSEFTTKAQGIVVRLAGSDGTLDAGTALRAQQDITNAWTQSYIEQWVPMFQALRREAVSIPFGSLAVRQEWLRKLAGRQKLLGEASTTDTVFEPQLRSLIEAANQRFYDDGLQISSRIWKLDREARNGIQQALMQGVAEKKSAWQIAKDLEQFLGASGDCPRWTSTRLYSLTKKDIASGVRTGLKTGAECDGQGVAYKALRLARTELQAVHGLATDRIMAAQPWIEKEQIVLSPAHPKPDVCDDVIAEGEDGQGIYPKGTIALPIHPNCICYAVAIMMPEEEFTGRLHDWVNGGSDPMMDDYANLVGADSRGQRGSLFDVSLLNDFIGQALIVWLIGDAKQIVERMQ